MRVEILANVRVPETSSPAPENRAFHAFLASVNGGDSLFRVTACSARPVAEAGAAGTYAFSGVVVLSFSDDALNGQSGLYYTLVEKLTELLKAEGFADSMEVRLGLFSRGEDGAQPPGQIPGQALVVELVSQGSSAEQAERRWGLGMAHLQQALLFISRLLRQQISSLNG